MVSRVVSADGTGLSVRRSPGDRPPRFLLVHGLASNARLWDGVAAELTDAGHPSTAVDLRGHGRSDRPDRGYTFPTLVEDLAAVIQTDGDAPVVAVGQSFGGNLVLELARRHPGLVAKVACIDGGFIHLAQRFADWTTAEAALAPPRFDGLGREEVERRIRERHPGWPEAAIDAQLANFEEIDGEMRARLARSHHLQLLRALWDQDPGETARDLEHPVLVIAATEDSPADSASVEAFVGALRRGRLRWMEGQHDIHAQRPGAVAAALLELAGAGAP